MAATNNHNNPKSGTWLGGGDTTGTAQSCERSRAVAEGRALATAQPGADAVSAGSNAQSEVPAGAGG